MTNQIEDINFPPPELEALRQLAKLVGLPGPEVHLAWLTAMASATYGDDDPVGWHEARVRDFEPVAIKSGVSLDALERWFDRSREALALGMTRK